MIKFLNAESIQSHEWSQLVDESLTATFFQTKACYDFYASLSFLKPVLFAVSENDKLVGLLCGYLISDGGSIKQFFSKRVIVPGGLLLNPSISDKALEVLLTTVKNNLKSQAIYIEIRNYVDFKSYIPAVCGDDQRSGPGYRQSILQIDAAGERLAERVSAVEGDAVFPQGCTYTRCGCVKSAFGAIHTDGEGDARGVL